MNEKYISFTKQGRIKFKQLLIRSRGKVSYPDFYALTGVSIGNLHKYENCEILKEIRVETLRKLAPHILFDGEQPDNCEEAVEKLKAAVTQELEIGRNFSPQTFDELLPLVEQLPDAEVAKLAQWAIGRWNQSFK